MLNQRNGECPDKMAVLTQPGCNPLKYVTNPLLFVCLADEHASLGEVVGNLLVLAFAGQKGSRNERHIIQPCASHGFGRSGNVIGK